MTIRVRDGERGSVTILLAFSMTIFFALAALAVDIGFLYLAQRRAQAVADLAVLAAATKYSTTSQTAATNAATTIETTNGYPSTAPTYPSTYRVKVVMTLPATQLVFGKIFGLASKSLTVTSVASAGTPLPAIWAGGNCSQPVTTTPGLQLNGGPFTINGSLESNGYINYFTGGGEVTNGDVINSSACPPPGTRGTVNGTISQQAAAFPDPLGYNMFTDFPPCTAGTDLTTVLGSIYNVPMVGGVIAPGVYCANGDVNLSSGSAVTGSGVTVLATGAITVSGPGLNITSAAPGAHNIIFFSNKVTADCTTQALNLGFPGGTLDGNVYAPNGCLQVSGDSYTLNGSAVGNEVQFGAGSNWSVGSTSGASSGDVSLYQ